ncbi:MAG: glycosyltransferase family 39 protein [Chloroflexota bacterium]
MNDDKQRPNPDLPQEEPTVLDLFKSVFKDWNSFFNFLVSAFDAVRREQINHTLVTERSLLPAEEAPLVTQPVGKSAFPFRSLAGLALGLLAQFLLEPQGKVLALGALQIEKVGRSIPMAVGMYVLAFALIAWGIFKQEWNLSPLPPERGGEDPTTVRLIPFLASIGFSFAAFISFDENLFTTGNLTLWLTGMVLFVYALWIPYRRARAPQSPYVRRRALLWGLLLLLAAGLVIFFRVYRIGDVPSEPFSDHAEKILDVYEVTQGQTSIFFPRNTGREAFQMYWTVLVSWIFGTGLSFLSLKIGTVLIGLLTLPYMYLLGKETGSRRVGLLALVLTGIGYWPNVISRVGLRFPLYPVFVAPTLYYLIRGLRTRNRNDFILSGLFLGIGLHGYSPIRILPIVVVVAVGLYLLHAQSRGARKDAALWLVMLGLTALVVFIPLLRYSLDNPEAFSYRAFSRLGSVEQPLPGAAHELFFSNLWNALRMFNYDDGEIWVHSVTHRPALDVVSATLFLTGVLLALVRYIRNRHWLDLFLLLSIPLLAMPSILSLAFPGENPALNRAGGAYIPAFLLAALALDGLLGAASRRNGGQAGASGKMRAGVAWGLGLLLVSTSAVQNYDLVFRQYADQFDGGAWNSSEMGAVIKEFGQVYGTTDTAWIVPYPHWVDTRLPGVWAGIPNRDFAIWPENLPDTVELPGPKLFLVKANVSGSPENDQETLDALKELYPQGRLELHPSDVEGHEFWVYFVPE